MGEREGIRVALWARRPEERSSVRQVFDGLGCAVREVETLDQLLDAVSHKSVDLIAAVFDRSFRRPLDLLAWSSAHESLPPVLLLSKGLDLDLYLEAMQRGAADCLSLPLSEQELASRLRASGLRKIPLQAVKNPTHRGAA